MYCKTCLTTKADDKMYCKTCLTTKADDKMYLRAMSDNQS